MEVSKNNNNNKTNGVSHLFTHFISNILPERIILGKVSIWGWNRTNEKFLRALSQSNVIRYMNGFSPYRWGTLKADMVASWHHWHGMWKAEKISVLKIISLLDTCTTIIEDWQLLYTLCPQFLCSVPLQRQMLLVCCEGKAEDNT